MMHVVISLILFFLAVTVHLLFCRKFSSPGLQAKAFLGIALGGFMFIWILFIFIPFDPWGPTLKLTAMIVYLLLIPAYLIFYVTTNLVSPSKKILKILQTQGKADYNELLSAIQSGNMVEGRLQELVTSSCAYQKESKFFLTPNGNRLLAMVKLYGWLSGRRMAG